MFCSPVLCTHSDTLVICLQNVDVQIGELFVKFDRQAEVLMKLHEEASKLPLLLQQLQNITDSLGKY